MTTLSPYDSVIFSRRLRGKSIGNQVYLPKRFLAGILPNSLVDKYSFWQSENDDIIGYLEFESADDDEEELIKAKRSSTGLMITLWKETEKDDTTRFCNSGAQALIRTSYIDSDAAIENKSLNISMMTLLNVSSASRRLY